MMGYCRGDRHVISKCLLKYDTVSESGRAFVKSSYIETCFAEHVGW
jgi:hypothetical protein